MTSESENERDDEEQEDEIKKKSTKSERSNIDVREALPINDTAPPHFVYWDTVASGGK